MLKVFPDEMHHEKYLEIPGLVSMPIPPNEARLLFLEGTSTCAFPLLKQTKPNPQNILKFQYKTLFAVCEVEGSFSKQTQYAVHNR